MAQGAALWLFCRTPSWLPAIRPVPASSYLPPTTRALRNCPPTCLFFTGAPTCLNCAGLPNVPMPPSYPQAYCPITSRRNWSTRSSGTTYAWPDARPYHRSRAARTGLAPPPGANAGRSRRCSDDGCHRSDYARSIADIPRSWPRPRVVVIEYGR